MENINTSFLKGAPSFFDWAPHAEVLGVPRVRVWVRCWVWSAPAPWELGARGLASPCLTWQPRWRRAAARHWPAQCVGGWRGI